MFCSVTGEDSLRSQVDEGTGRDGGVNSEDLKMWPETGVEDVTQNRRRLGKRPDFGSNVKKASFRQIQ